MIDVLTQKPSSSDHIKEITIARNYSKLVCWNSENIVKQRKLAGAA